MVGVHEVVNKGMGETSASPLGVGGGLPVVPLVDQQDHHGGRQHEEGEGHQQQHHRNVGVG